MYIIIQGKKTTMAIMTAAIFGAKARVASLIEVTAWKMLIKSPTTRAQIRSGAERMNTASKLLLPSWTTISGVIQNS